MTQEYNLIYQPPVEPNEKAGWVKIDEDGSIEWEFDRNNPHYPNVKKLLYSIEAGKADIDTGLTGVVVEDNSDSDESSIHGEKERRLSQMDVWDYIASNLPDREVAIDGLEDDFI